MSGMYLESTTRQAVIGVAMTRPTGPHSHVQKIAAPVAFDVVGDPFFQVDEQVFTTWPGRDRDEDGQRGEHLVDGGRILVFFGTTADIGYLEQLVETNGLVGRIVSRRELEKDGHAVEYRTYRIEVADLALPGTVEGD